MSSVSLHELRRAYGPLVVVDGFTQEIASGEFVSFLGPSGCGKTTTLRMIAGLDQPTAGEVRIGQRVVSSPAAGVFVPPEQRRLGMVFQTYALWPHMTVGENVAYPLKLRGVPRPERDSAAERTLDLVHLGGLGDRQPYQLSGGQQQRVALARALAMEPEVLLLDEPLSNLDARLREELRFEIKDLQRRLGITVVFVTHDQSEAMAMSDRIVVMRQGRVRQVGKPRDIYRRPADAFVAGFIGVANFIEGTVESSDDSGCRVRLGTLPGAPLVSCAGSLPAGVLAVVALRPEALRLRPAGRGHAGLGSEAAAGNAGPSPGGPRVAGRLEGHVDRLTFLGDRVDCRVVCGPVQLRVNSLASEAPAEAATVVVEVAEACAFAK